MAKKALIVIDMQKDFLTGALANPEGEAIIPAVAKRIEEYEKEGCPVFFTRDTHTEEYMNTQEGRLLPVPHCIKGTDGWQIAKELRGFADEGNVLDKLSFGCMELPTWIAGKLGETPKELELCGVCTDICVISNAVILKAAFPETKIEVKGRLCAGVTPESHENALNAMKNCQIIVE